MNLIILGAGGHGKVVADLARQTRKYKEIYFLDDNQREDFVIDICSNFFKYKNLDIEMYPAFGNNEFRLKWENKIEKEGIKLAKIIHSSAYISPYASIADGCVVMPCSIINTNTKIKKACIINCGAIIDHDCTINEGCHIAPGAIVKGENIIPVCTKIDSGSVISLGFYK